MKIKDNGGRGDFIEITIWKVADSSNSYGIPLDVYVSTGGFTGRSYTLVDRLAARHFLDALRLLELMRSGFAEIKALVEREFYLRVEVVDKLGHVAVEGEISKVCYGAYAQFDNKIGFSLEYDPTLLLALIKEFSALFTYPPPES